MTRPNMKILLDMDGVLADFLAGASKVHKRPLPYDRPEALGRWDTEELWGITPKQFWTPIDATVGFWKGLDKTAEADAIVQLACEAVGRKNVAILTAPSQWPGCISEKLEWIGQYYPYLKGRVIFGSAKEFMASPNRILVDDKDLNISAFEDAEGHGVLVPRLWNSAHSKANRTLEIVQDKLEEIFATETNND